MERSGKMSLFLRYYVQDVDTGVYHSDPFDTIHDACVWIDKHTPKIKVYLNIIG